jgi:AraC-like DNA-binding protein
MRPADLAFPSVFSTAGLPDARRIELWEEHNATALIGLAVHAPVPLTATERNLQLATSHLARVRGTAHVVERSAEIIRRDPAEAVAVYLSLRGDSWFRQDGSTKALRAGDVVACDADRPFARGFARGLEEIVVKVPRHVLAERTGRSADLGPGVTFFTSARPPRPARPARPTRSAGDPDASAPYARALARMAGRATSDTRPVPADEHAVLDLVAVVVAGRHVAQAVSHRAAATSLIEDHLTDPALGAAWIASAIGISERQLSRVFASDGTSVPRHILGRRLHLAYALLAEPAGRGAAGGAGGGDRETVADIAARCGFTSAAYFSHAFVDHFGLRASELRREAREAREARQASF